MVRFEDTDAWLVQRQLVDLLNMARQNIKQHTMVIYGSGELAVPPQELALVTDYLALSGR